MVEGERELICRFQEGSLEAFDELMRLFQDKALSLAYYQTGNREDALDVTQEAFIRLYRVLPRWKPKASLFTWLYRVIVNLSIDLLRSKKRRAEVGLTAVPEPAGPARKNNPRREAEEIETAGEVARAVAGLPDRQRAAFVLRHYQGLSLKDIAEVQRCSPGAVKANLFHAVRKLRSRLKNYYKP
jgi:RNA polymerase sigma-70 factor (ECF subfamily)